MAEYERITLDEAYNLPTIQFLNDLSYLKMKDKYDAALVAKINKK